MIAYIISLQKATECANARADQARELKLMDQKDGLVPLDERLRRLLSTIPNELQREGLHIESLRERLKGRGRGSCHPGELGRALARLGFQRQRKWVKGEPQPTVWVLK